MQFCWVLSYIFRSLGPIFLYFWTPWHPVINNERFYIVRETCLSHVCTGSYFSKQWTVLSNCHFISINYKKILVQGCFAQIHERLRSQDIKIHLKFLFVVSLLLLIWKNSLIEIYLNCGWHYAPINSLLLYSYFIVIISVYYYYYWLTIIRRRRS